jgi:hypothetical protein
LTVGSERPKNHGESQDVSFAGHNGP